uniref:7TM_GPCR_Srx domain-containing protein n=1 Tax=Panagrellus redivivus TaxID=6233 RepID=A0A7E4WC24_PANRE
MTFFRGGHPHKIIEEIRVAVSGFTMFLILVVKDPGHLLRLKSWTSHACTMVESVTIGALISKFGPIYTFASAQLSFLARSQFASVAIAIYHSITLPQHFIFLGPPPICCITVRVFVLISVRARFAFLNTFRSSFFIIFAVVSKC